MGIEMILILIGKTASGKDTIAKELVRNYQFHKIITYTTRPPRPTEKDGIDYHFISKSDFQAKIKSNFFVEWKVYKSAFGDWYYGTALDDLQDNSVVILTPLGVCDLAKTGQCSFRVALIDSPMEIRMQRLVDRGDEYTEALRRLKYDEKDFSIPAVNRLVDFKVENMDQPIENIAREIFDFWEKEKK